MPEVPPDETPSQTSSGDWPPRPSWRSPDLPSRAAVGPFEPPASEAPAGPLVGGSSEPAGPAGSMTWTPSTSAAAPIASALLLTTTGVPHYLPPAALPELPGGGTFHPPASVAPPRGRRRTMHFVGRGVRELAETIVLALMIFLLVRSVVQNFQVEGKSMEPTLETGWYLLVNKALYWEINLETVDKFLPFVEPGDDPTRYIFRGPRRGDVIVFRAPEETPGQTERDFIKRIIGLPGETVEVRDCTVFINGKPLDEPYILQRPTYTFPEEQVPDGHYFVLGDNRNNSSDSHSWGMLPKGNIIGQAWLTYWPSDFFGLIDNTSVTPQDAPATTNSTVPKIAAC